MAVSSGGAVHLWDVATGRLRNTLEVEGGVDSVSFSPDSKTLVTTSDDRGEKTVRLWDVIDSHAPKYTLKDTPVNVKNVSFSPEGPDVGKCGVVAGGTRRYDCGMLRLARSYETLDASTRGRANSVSLSPDGQILASGSSDETVRAVGCFGGHTPKYP